jgi:hypothetical protein
MDTLHTNIEDKSLLRDTGEHKKDLTFFIQQKLEKLTTAVYMVSSYIEEDENIKTSLRKLSLSLLSGAASLNTTKGTGVYDGIEKDIDQMIMLIKLSKTMFFVSEMNAHILTDEFQKLLSLLRNEKEKKFVSSFNLTLEGEKVFYRERKNGSLSLIPSREDAYHTLEKEEDKKEATEKGELKRELPADFPKALTFPVRTPTTPRISKTTMPEIKERRSSRRESVVALLSKDSAMSIKDLSLKIKGCSEKTIQRELNALLDEKKIKRLGEKRWSKYLLA